MEEAARLPFQLSFPLAALFSLFPDEGRINPLLKSAASIFYIKEAGFRKRERGPTWPAPQPSSHSFKLRLASHPPISLLLLGTLTLTLSPLTQLFSLSAPAKASVWFSQ